LGNSPSSSDPGDGSPLWTTCESCGLNFRGLPLRCRQISGVSRSAGAALGLLARSQSRQGVLGLDKIGPDAQGLLVVFNRLLDFCLLAAKRPPSSFAPWHTRA
jgi:hypothetical protein